MWRPPLHAPSATWPRSLTPRRVSHRVELLPTPESRLPEPGREGDPDAVQRDLREHQEPHADRVAAWEDRRDGGDRHDGDPPLAAVETGARDADAGQRRHRDRDL